MFVKKLQGECKAGKCFWLYTEGSFNGLKLQIYPEMCLSNLATMCLTLMRLGVHDLVHFDYMDPPAPATLIRALDELNYLGALDDEGNLTELGETMSAFPLHPEMAKMLTVSPQFKCSSEILSICSMLSVPCCFFQPKEALKAADEAKGRFNHIEGDHFALLNLYKAFKRNEVPQWYYTSFINLRVLQTAEKVRQNIS